MNPPFYGRDLEENPASIRSLADRAMLRLLWRMALPVRHLLGWAFVLMLGNIAADLARPYMMKVAIDNYIIPGNATALDNLFVVYVATIAASLGLSFGENLLLQMVLSM